MTVVAMPIWFSAAMTPSATMNTAAASARKRPYETAPSAARSSSFTACAIAEAMTTMMTATASLGSQATMARSRSLTGFGPNTLNAICNVISRTA